jgi:hypothetical protein
MAVGASAVPAHIAWWRSRWLRAAGSLAVVAQIFGFFFPKVASCWPMLTAWLPTLSSTGGCASR